MRIVVITIAMMVASGLLAEAVYEFVGRMEQAL